MSKLWIYGEPQFDGMELVMYPGQWGSNTIQAPISDINSVINESSYTICGTSLQDRSRVYRFWPGGQWSYVGSPFSSDRPLNAFYRC
ncbi:hypothetical protein ACFWBV_30675 [Streptomyces sp. NPDC060030]|uniref:hypothetical protein n=1 Tax=Streptomyces sp. NPDC060030 TaxID=3347042 RepID=UPI0036CFF8CD